MAYPKGINKAHDSFSLFLNVPDNESLPTGWRRHAKVSFSLVNQGSEKLSQRKVTQHWFVQKAFTWGFPVMITHTELNAKMGFLVNGELKVVAKIEVLEVVGKLDVSKESSPIMKTIDVNGFQVLPSQAESVKRIFERHPYMALEFRAKNQQLRASCINVLLSLIKTLCQSLQDISIDDLGQTEQVLTFLQNSGFKVDWLERKLEEVKEKKIQEHIGKSRMQGLEEDLKVFKKKCSDIEALLEKEKEELKGLKQKCSDIEALLEKEKGKVLAAAARTPLTFDDIL